MIDADQVKALLLQHVEQLVQHLYPNGRREGHHWVCGDVTGTPGKSFKVCLTGEKAGLWGDFAGGEHHKSLLDLWMQNRNVDFPTALHQAAEWLGCPLRGNNTTPKTPTPAKSGEAASTDDQAIAALAALHPLEYDRRRKEKAKELNCREATLDKLVDTKRPKGNDTLQGGAVILPEVEQWPEAVNGAEVLSQVAYTFGRYIALPDGAVDAIAFWIMHAHAFEASIHSPRLNFRSPELGCGKTLALDVVATLVPRPLRTESITPAVLFRLVESHKPTMLLDEVDSYLKEANELRGLLNAGYKRGALALRCEGEDNAVRCFKAFSPAALAGIGELPGTLHSRAIVIMLKRAKPGEVKERFDSRHTEKETELCRKLARWAADNFEALKDCDPQLPETAFNRVADNWRPFFAIAQIVGKDWPKRASEAFAKLTSSNDLDAQGVGTMLLADIATLFSNEGTDKLPSAKLADLLAAIEGRPWAEWGRQQKPISPNQLAKLLRRFGISPQVIRTGDETHRGYPLEQFQEAFDRYTPEVPPPDRNSVTMLGKTPVSRVKQPESVLHPEKGLSSRECYGVTLQKGGLGDGQPIDEWERLIADIKVTPRQTLGAEEVAS
jgi:putative DNA primase/helicase